MSIDLPFVTRCLLIANVAVYLIQLLVVQMLAGDVLIYHFALWPWGPEHTGQAPDGSIVTVGFHLWQMVTYGFLHGNLTHLAFNMLALYMFGGPIERLFGAREFAIYYFVCVIGAALAQLLVVAWYTGGFYPTLGASGGVFGVLLAFGMMYPKATIVPLFPPIPMPAWLFVTLYGGLELYLGVTGTKSGIAHFAHLGGMLGGFVLIQYWRGRLPLKPRRQLTR